MSDPLSPIVITLRDLYDQQVRVVDAMTELRTDVRRSLDRHDSAEECLDDHEARIRAVERRLWALPTLATLVSLGTLAAMVIPKLSP